MKAKTSRWVGFTMGLLASAWKGAEAKLTKTTGPLPKKEDGRPQLRAADAVGVFQLGHVDCEPYQGPSQMIRIEEDGAIECIQQDVWKEGENRMVIERRELGRVTHGTLLRGEIEQAVGIKPTMLSPNLTPARAAGLRKVC